MNEFKIKNTQGQLMDVLEICSRLQMSPKKMEENLRREMKTHGYGPDSDVGRMIEDLQRLRNHQYRVNISAAMKALGSFN